MKIKHVYSYTLRWTFLIIYLFEGADTIFSYVSKMAEFLNIIDLHKYNIGNPEL